MLQLHTADVIGTDQSAHDSMRLHVVLSRLALTATGQSLLRVATKQRLTIRYVDPDELHYNGRGFAAGQYCSNGRVVNLSRRACADENEALSVLAHELQHFVDDVRGRNGWSIQSEVRANLAEAAVCHELGINGRSMAQNADGSLRSAQETERFVRASPWYRDFPDDWSTSTVADPRAAKGYDIARRRMTANAARAGDSIVACAPQSRTEWSPHPIAGDIDRLARVLLANAR